MNEAQDMVGILLKLPPDWKDGLAVAAAAAGVTQNEYIRSKIERPISRALGGVKLSTPRKGGRPRKER